MSYKVTRDHKTIFNGSHDECFVFILNDQHFSVDYAMKYEGYKIIKDKEKDE